MSGAARSGEYRGWTVRIAAGWGHWTVDLSKPAGDGQAERHSLRAPTEAEAIARAREFVDQIEGDAEPGTRPRR